MKDSAKTKKTSRQLKIDWSHVNEDSRRFLSRLFKEAKWFINYALDERYAFNRIITEDVSVITAESETDCDCFDQVELQCLTVGMRKSILFWIEKQATETGKQIPFVKSYPTIALRFGRDYELDLKNRRLMIAGLEQHLKLSGMDQILQLPADTKFLTAYLTKEDRQKYYLSVKLELQDHSQRRV